MSYEYLVQEAKMLSIEEQFNLIAFLLNNLKDYKSTENSRKKYSSNFLSAFGSGKDLDLKIPDEIPIELDSKRESI